MILTVVHSVEILICLKQSLVYFTPASVCTLECHTETISPLKPAYFLRDDQYDMNFLLSNLILLSILTSRLCGAVWIVYI